MTNQETIHVASVINGQLGISAEDGQKVFDKLNPLVAEGKQVTVSFENISMLISLFLNVAIGQLYGFFGEDTIRKQLRVEGLSPDDMELLKRVIDNAKKYYANKKGYDEAWQKDGSHEE